MINTVNPDGEDRIAAEGVVALRWLKLQRAMIGESGRDRRNACAQLLDALDVESHVSRRIYGMGCEDGCWVCERAAEQAATVEPATEPEAPQPPGPTPEEQAQ